MAFSISGLLSSLPGIGSLISSLFGSIGQLFNSLKKHVTNVIGIWDAAVKLRDSVLEEVDAWKNFKQDIRFKSRVINLERAIEKTRDLIQGVPDSWHAILDIIKEVKTQFEETSPEGTTSEIEQEFAEGIEQSGLKGLLERFPRLLRGLEKSLGVLAIIFGAAEKVRDVIDDLQTIVDELRRVRLEIEKLDTVFLSQSNKRKTLKLADGSSIRIRIGNLHQ